MRTMLALCTLALLPWGEGAAAPGDFSPERISAHVKVLASDEFEGRKPGTAGENKATAYIVERFKALGVKPGCHGSYFQPVPLVEIAGTAGGPMTVSKAGRQSSFALREDVIFWSRRKVERAAIDNAPMIFVGYGIVAPELGWNDYRGVDVRGKIVVILVNEPGFSPEDRSLFKGRELTRYGRWTYKFEEAARQGAVGAIIVHEEAAASYPWSVVVNGKVVPRLHLVPSDGDTSRTLIEGWIQAAAADRLFSDAGLSFSALKAEAGGRNFRAVKLGATATLSVNNRFRQVVSNNVVGILPGLEKADEVVLYTAHWDHIGRGRPVNGDAIYNGAVDNASGVAGLIELARAFSQGKRPERSVAFISFTAEEQGLLGSEYYALSPVFRPDSTVAAINMDMLSTIGPSRDMTLLGAGKSDLDAMLSDWLAGAGRKLSAEPFPERGLFYRSDQINLAAIGIPVLYARAGLDNIPHGPDDARALVDDFTRNRYHQPADQWSPDLDFLGAAFELEALYGVGARLASGDEWPKWRGDAEFRRPGTGAASRAEALPARCGPLSR